MAGKNRGTDKAAFLLPANYLLSSTMNSEADNNASFESIKKSERSSHCAALPFKRAQGIYQEAEEKRKNQQTQSLDVLNKH